METFLNFIVNYWQYISVGLVVIFEIVLMLIKKRPMSLDAFQEAWNNALKNLPRYIYSVESLSDELTGEGKKDAVISRALSFMSDELGRQLTEKEICKVEGSFSSMIEAILYCPTRKGGKGREQVEQAKK